MIQRWLLIPDVNGVSWTLAIEMQFYVLLFLLIIITRQRLTTTVIRWVISAWLLVALAVAIWAYPQAHGLDPQVVATKAKMIINVTVAEYGPLFCTGMLAYLSRRNRRWETLIPVSVVTAMLTAGLLETWEHAIWVGSLCVVFVVVALREHTRPLLWFPIQWLGKISYSLYLVHSILGYAIIHYTWPYVGRNGAIVVAIVAALAASWAVWAVFENRVSPWLRRTLERRPPTRRSEGETA